MSNEYKVCKWSKHSQSFGEKTADYYYSWLHVLITI